MIFPRFTLAREVVFEGLGLHLGIPVTVRIHPSDSGIRFHHAGRAIPATPESVTDTERHTVLGDVRTVEHLMSALAGLEVTDADVEVSSPELPALDGSALPFVEGIISSGLDRCGEMSIEGPFERVYVSEGRAKLSIAAGSGHWRYTFTSSVWPYELSTEFEDVRTAYAREIAPARTWCFTAELDALRSAGLGKGLGPESVLLIGEGKYDTSERFPDEPARHKLLDAIGDLYLSGVPLSMLGVSATHTGHRLHVQAARKLAESVRIERR